jgi:hypothetical protein
MGIFVCGSGSRSCVVLIILHSVCSVVVALLLLVVLLLKHMRVASTIGYGVQLSGTTVSIYIVLMSVQSKLIDGYENM